MKRTARCHCRRLTASVTGEPMQVYLCHCRACQRRTGSIAHWGNAMEERSGNPCRTGEDIHPDGRQRVRDQVPFLLELRHHRDAGR